ncbi:hypothetical protein MBLNU459_g7307t1 [Dothideomycetes sp. NU459]
MGPEVVKHIQECYEEEQRNPPVPREYGDIPISYDAITTEWLTATLGRRHPGAVVKSFQLGPVDNGTSNRRHIVLEWEGEGTGSAPTSVFCKAAHNRTNRIMLANGGTYSEVTFFNRVRPTIDIEAPTAYFAAYDPESWRSMIVLQDMGPRTTFCTHDTALSKQQFAEQFQILARLHGRFYETKVEFFRTLLGTRERFMNNVKSLDIETVCGNGFRAAKDVIPPRLFAREAEIWPLTIASVERNDILPQTVVHSDVHLGNWYITPDGHMGLTDWQATSHGHWSRDLAYVLGTGVPTDKRRLWERDMVRLYVAELARAGGPAVSEHEAWAELRRQTFGPLWYWTFTLTPSKIMPDMQPVETTLDFIGRITALMDDHDALDSFKDL